MLFLVSLIPSIIALIFRCQGRGAPFATMASSTCSALTIIIVAVLAAAAAFFAHQVPGLSDVPPIVTAVVVPWTLCVRRLQAQRDPASIPQARSIHMVIVSAGCVLLLRWLDTQMSMDKNDWVEGEDGWESWSPEELTVKSRDFSNRLKRLAATNEDLCKKVKSDWSFIKRKLVIAQDTCRKSAERAEALNAAREAYLVLRGRAYDEGYRRRFDPTLGRRRIRLPSWAFGR
jgi:hypothetical protein